ncbi:hypothetical protein KKB55_21915, partial [Myxococcota bacterium]|nr:hypothetical protein [Myxococcota bacterium]MBU1900409.1 hypothetical protein [Myxococcota bacterium]
MNTDKHLDALAPLLETAEEAGRDEAAQAALIAGLSPEARRAWEALEATARLSAAQPSPRLTPARR